MTREVRRDRVMAGVLTLAVHGLFLLMLQVESRLPARPLPSSRQPVSAWIQLPITPPPREVSVPQQELPTPARPPMRTARQPATAITLPPTTETTSPRPSDETRGPIDWYAEAARVRAQRESEEEFRNKVIGAPVAKMREPCEPQESSMFPWTKEEIMRKENPNPPANWTSMLPPATGRPIGAGMGGVGVGFSIPLGKPEPNKHLFDDMKEGKTPPSSVPDPNVCD